MKLISLVENSSARTDCGCIHGLSLYIETEQQRILFDLGPNALFLENAAVLGVDISRVDLAFLSHGHFDHGGALSLFCKRNEKAPILVAKDAFKPHAVCTKDGHEDIGLLAGDALRFAHRLQHKEGRTDDTLFVLSEICDRDYATAASAHLLEKRGEDYIQDDFAHEQSLILTCAGKHYLIAGCAHRGIVNILRAGEAVIGGAFDFVIAGFHLTNPSLGIDEPEALIRAVGAELLARPRTKYMTGHCTGTGPYAILQEILGDRLCGMPAGSVHNI